LSFGFDRTLGLGLGSHLCLIERDLSGSRIVSECCGFVYFLVLVFWFMIRCEFILWFVIAVRLKFEESDETVKGNCQLLVERVM